MKKLCLFILVGLFCIPAYSADVTLTFVVPEEYAEMVKSYVNEGVRIRLEDDARTAGMVVAKPVIDEKMTHVYEGTVKEVPVENPIVVDPAIYK